MDKQVDSHDDITAGEASPQPPDKDNVVTEVIVEVTKNREVITDREATVELTANQPEKEGTKMTPQEGISTTSQEGVSTTPQEGSNTTDATEQVQPEDYVIGEKAGESPSVNDIFNHQETATPPVMSPQSVMSHESSFEERAL